MTTNEVLDNLDAAAAETLCGPAIYQRSRDELTQAIYARWQQRNHDDLQFEQQFVAREALARCKGILAAGGKPDFDTEHAAVCAAIGVSRQTAPAKYAKRQSATLLPGQTEQVEASGEARRLCEQDRAAGRKPDFDARYREVCRRKGFAA
jgi:hypothetical protein